MKYLDLPTADSPEEAVRHDIHEPILKKRRTEENELELELFGHGEGWRGEGGGRRQCVCYRAARPLTPMRRGLLGALLGAHRGCLRKRIRFPRASSPQVDEIDLFSFALDHHLRTAPQHCSLPPRFLHKLSSSACAHPLNR